MQPGSRDRGQGVSPIREVTGSSGRDYARMHSHLLPGSSHLGLVQVVRHCLSLFVYIHNLNTSEARERQHCLFLGAKHMCVLQ